jgi:hypothetical protein
VKHISFKFTKKRSILYLIMRIIPLVSVLSAVVSYSSANIFSALNKEESQNSKIKLQQAVSATGARARTAPPTATPTATPTAAAQTIDFPDGVSIPYVSANAALSDSYG